MNEILCIFQKVPLYAQYTDSNEFLIGERIFVIPS